MRQAAMTDLKKEVQANTNSFVRLMEEGKFMEAMRRSLTYIHAKKTCTMRLCSVVALSALLTAVEPESEYQDSQYLELAKEYFTMFDKHRQQNQDLIQRDARLKELVDMTLSGKYLCHRMAGENVLAHCVLKEFNQDTIFHLNRCTVEGVRDFVRDWVMGNNCTVSLEAMMPMLRVPPSAQVAEAAWAYLQRPIEQRDQEQSFIERQRLQAYAKANPNAPLSCLSTRDFGRYAAPTAAMLLIFGGFQSRAMEFDGQLACALVIRAGDPTPVAVDECLFRDTEGFIDHSDVLVTSQEHRWLRYSARKELTATDVDALLREFISSPMEHLDIIYCGHGQRDTGDLVMFDGSIFSLEAMRVILDDRSTALPRNITITLNSCFGSVWERVLSQMENITIVAATRDETPAFMGIYCEAYDHSRLASLRPVLMAIGHSVGLNAEQVASDTLMTSLVELFAQDEKERGGRFEMPESPKDLVPLLPQIERLREPVLALKHPIGFNDGNQFSQFLLRLYSCIRTACPAAASFSVVFQGSSVQGFSWKCKGRTTRLFCDESDYDIAIVCSVLADTYGSGRLIDGSVGCVPPGDPLEAARVKVKENVGRDVSFLILSSEEDVKESGKASFVTHLEAAMVCHEYATLGFAKNLLPTNRSL